MNRLVEIQSLARSNQVRAGSDTDRHFHFAEHAIPATLYAVCGACGIECLMSRPST